MFSNIGDAISLATQMAKEITSTFPSPIDLKFEKVYWPAILQTKKRYCGYPWEDADKKPDFEAKGIETVRRDGTRATSKILKQVCVTLFDEILETNEFDIKNIKGMIQILRQDFFLVNPFLS